MNKYIVGLLNNYDVHVTHPRHQMVLHRQIRAIQLEKLSVTYSDEEKRFYIGYIYIDKLDVIANTIAVVFDADIIPKTLHLSITYQQKPIHIQQFLFDISIGIHFPLADYWLDSDYLSPTT